MTRTLIALLLLSACTTITTSVTVAGDCTTLVQTDKLAVSIVNRPQPLLPILVPLPVPYQVLAEKLPEVEKPVVPEKKPALPEKLP